MVFNIEEGGEGVDLGKVVDAIRAAEAGHRRAPGGGHERGSDRRGARLGLRVGSKPGHLAVPRSSSRPTRVGVYVLVEVRPGRVVAIASVHPPAEPYGPELAGRGATEAEVIALERRIRLPKAGRAPAHVLPGLAEGGIPVFLLGDFNAPSHLDWTADAVGLRWHVRRPVDWPMSRAVEAAGFRDAWREIHPDPVAEPGLTWWASRPPTGGYEPGPDTPNDRIDLLYAAGPAVVRDLPDRGRAWRTGRDHRDPALAVRPSRGRRRCSMSSRPRCPERSEIAPARRPGGRADARPGSHGLRASGIRSR